MSTGKIELSVGAIKYVDPNEMITEEEFEYIKNKVPELDGRVGDIEGEIEEINSSLDNIAFNFDNLKGDSDNEKLKEIEFLPFGSVLNFTPNKTYNFNDTLLMKTGMTINGNNATLNFICSESMKCLQVVDKCTVENININQLGVNVSGSDNGDRRSPIIIGDYNSGIGYKDIKIYNVTLTGNRIGGNLLTVIGDSSNIDISNVYFPYSEASGRAILLHWGGFRETKTTHPYDISLNNIKIEGVKGSELGNNAGIFISGCHNIKVDNIDIANVMNGVLVYPGDEGYTLADEDIKPFAMKNISIKNVNISKFTNKAIIVQNASGITKFGYRMFTSVENANIIGQGTGDIYGVWTNNANNVVFKNINVENVKYGFYLTNGSSFVHIKDSFVKLYDNASGYGIMCDIAYNTKIENCEVVSDLNNATGIRGKLCKYLTIDDCKISGFTRQIYHETNTMAHIFNGCKIRNCILIGDNSANSVGLYLMVANNSVIENCEVSNNDRGIVLGECCNNVKISNSTVYSNSTVGITLGVPVNESLVSKKLTVDNCIVFNNLTGILTGIADDVTINNNTLGAVGETVQDYAISTPTARLRYKIFDNIVLGSKNLNTFNLGTSPLFERMYLLVSNNNYAFDNATVPLINYLPCAIDSKGNTIQFSTDYAKTLYKEYKQGDIIFNRNATTGQPRGWVCTIGGSPGTWVSLGNI